MSHDFREMEHQLARSSYDDRFNPYVVFFSLTILFFCMHLCYSCSHRWLFFGCSYFSIGTKLATSPPSLLSMMTSFFLKMGGVDEGALIYESQPTVQVILLLTGVLAVPVLLLVKPLVLRSRAKAAGLMKSSSSVVSSHSPCLISSSRFLFSLSYLIVPIVILSHSYVQFFLSYDVTAC